MKLKITFLLIPKKENNIDDWPQDNFPKNRKWVINEYDECLSIFYFFFLN
jgi:hypothetical protein